MLPFKKGFANNHIHLTNTNVAESVALKTKLSASNLAEFLDFKEIKLNKTIFSFIHANARRLCSSVIYKKQNATNEVAKKTKKQTNKSKTAANTTPTTNNKPNLAIDPGLRQLIGVSSVKCANEIECFNKIDNWSLSAFGIG